MMYVCMYNIYIYIYIYILNTPTPSMVHVYDEQIRSISSGSSTNMDMRHGFMMRLLSLIGSIR